MCSGEGRGPKLELNRLFGISLRQHVCVMDHHVNLRDNASRWAGVGVGMHEVGRCDSVSWLQISPVKQDAIIRDDPSVRKGDLSTWVGPIMCSTASSRMIGISVLPLTSRSAFPAVADGVRRRLEIVSQRLRITLMRA
jgi:hypothetical protein